MGAPASPSYKPLGWQEFQDLVPSCSRALAFGSLSFWIFFGGMPLVLMVGFLGFMLL